jgi:hypothetical protein
MLIFYYAVIREKFICCNTRKEAENLKRRLEPYFKDPEQLKIYATREGETIGEVNNEWYFKSLIITGRPDSDEVRLRRCARAKLLSVRSIPNLDLKLLVTTKLTRPLHLISTHTA